MPTDPNATPPAPPQPDLPGVAPDPIEAPAVEEPTFTLAQAREMIDKSAKQAAEQAVADYKAEQAADSAPPEGDPVAVEPPKPKEENVLLQAELEAERKARADLEAKVEGQAANELKRATMDKIAELLSKHTGALTDPQAQRAMAAEIYESKAYTFTDGNLGHTDLTAQPSQIITDFLASRAWYQTKLPEGMGAAPAAIGTPHPGTNGQSTAFDSSNFMDFYDAADAATAWDRKHPKG